MKVKRALLVVLVLGLFALGILAGDTPSQMLDKAGPYKLLSDRDLRVVTAYRIGLLANVSLPQAMDNSRPWQVLSERDLLVLETYFLGQINANALTNLSPWLNDINGGNFSLTNVYTIKAASFEGSGAALVDIQPSGIENPPWVEGGLELAWGNGLRATTNGQVLTATLDSTTDLVLKNVALAPAAWLGLHSNYLDGTNWVWTQNLGTPNACGLFHIDSSQFGVSYLWTNGISKASLVLNNASGASIKELADTLAYYGASTVGNTTPPDLSALTWATLADGAAPVPGAAKIFYAEPGMLYANRLYTNHETILWSSNGVSCATTYVTGDKGVFLQTSVLTETRGRRYRAIVNQEGEANPTVLHTFENSLGSSVAWTRYSPGDYLLTVTNGAWRGVGYYTLKLSMCYGGSSLATSHYLDDANQLHITVTEPGTGPMDDSLRAAEVDITTWDNFNF